MKEIEKIVQREYRPGIEYPIVDTVEAIMKVLNKGAEKYRANGWKQGIKFDPISNTKSMIGHITAPLTGQKIDPDSGNLHIENAACRIAMALLAEKNNLAGYGNPRAISLFDEQNI